MAVRHRTLINQHCCISQVSVPLAVACSAALEFSLLRNRERMEINKISCSTRVCSVLYFTSFPEHDDEVSSQIRGSHVHPSTASAVTNKLCNLTLKDPPSRYIFYQCFRPRVKGNTNISKSAGHILFKYSFCWRFNLGPVSLINLP